MSRTRINLNLALLLALVMVLGSGGSSGGAAAPFKSEIPCMLSIADLTPSAVKELDVSHPGIADIFSSDADGSAHDWLRKHYGEFRIIDKSAPKPVMDKQWVQDAHDAWKLKGGKYPWVVGAGPTGRGFNQQPPETLSEMLALLKPLSR
jgi:hypothetical protein